MARPQIVIETPTLNAWLGVSAVLQVDEVGSS